MTTPQASPEERTILVVDDDPSVRSLISATLARRGYRVLEASDGLEAYTLFSQHPGSIDLIITDLIMPKMTGFDLLQAVRATPSSNPPRPPTPVIVVSGTALQDLRVPIASLNVPLLPKPVSLEVLLQTVRDLLDPSR